MTMGVPTKREETLQKAILELNARLSEVREEIEDNDDENIEDCEDVEPTKTLFQKLISDVSREYFIEEDDYASVRDEDLAKFNRYPDYVPYQHNVAMTNPTRYVNASMMEVNGQHYIATDAPKPETFNNFWNMTWEKNVSQVVMLTELIENRKPKAHVYWPRDEGESDKFETADGETYTVTCEKITNTVTDSNFTAEQHDNFKMQYIKQYHLKFQKGSEEKRLTLSHYRHLTDHGAPSTQEDMKSFNKLIEMTSSGTKDSPVLVHCSAGVGRTGMFMACHSLTKNPSKIPMGYLQAEEAAAKLVLTMRSQRQGCVQTDTQLDVIVKQVLSNM